MARIQVAGEIQFPGDAHDPSSRSAVTPATVGAASISQVPTSYRHRPLSWRDSRFACILLAILAMSLADLSMTLIHATSIGMQEENPIARLLMRYGGICSICVWKAGTVAIGVFILWRIRHHRCSEVGAWLCFSILAALCFHWASYNAQLSSLTNEVLSLDKSTHTSEWVVMHPEAVR
ncbi:MAG: hypothetical protein KF691_15835 [Phycisphaeraceae bacterium]|nr:hypothetical protein [Phycisphaeraceae bacterium]